MKYTIELGSKQVGTWLLQLQFFINFIYPLFLQIQRVIQKISTFPGKQRSRCFITRCIRLLSVHFATAIICVALLIPSVPFVKEESKAGNEEHARDRAQHNSNDGAGW